MEHSRIFGVTFEEKMPCMVCKGLYACLLLCSIFSLFTIALDRSLAVNYPLRYVTITRNHKLLFVKSILWCWAVFSGGMIIGNSIWKPGTVCLFNNIIPRWMYYSLGAGIPLITIVITTLIYVQIFWTAKKQRQKIEQQQGSLNDERKNFKSLHKSTKMMAMILGLFVLSWIPFFLSGVVHRQIYGKPYLIYVEVFMRFLSVMAFSNSCVNPIIYGWKNKQFRKAYREALSVCWKIKAEESGNASNTRTTVSQVVSSEK